MPTQSSMLYMRRKHRVKDIRRPRPQFATGSLHSHTREHTPLAELRDVENPATRLATRPIEEVPAHAEGNRDCCTE